MLMYDVVTVGEILVEVMRPELSQPLDLLGNFRGPFASGAPAIFAVASARLGLQTAFIGTVGDDAFGRLLRNRLDAEKVDTTGLQTSSEHASGVAFVAYDSTGGREFVFHIRHAAAGQLTADQIPRGLFTQIGWLHLSGSTIFLNEGSRATCLRALEWTQAAGGQISLDLNLRPELMPLPEARTALAPFIAAADLLLPTAEEAHLITGEVDDFQAFRTLAGKPGTIVVLKRGSEGCSVYKGAAHFDVPGFSVAEVDPTGAGDCFSAAFITGLLKNWSLEKTARFANAAGALAVTQFGPMEGAPMYQQVEMYIR